MDSYDSRIVRVSGVLLSHASTAPCCGSSVLGVKRRVHCDAWVTKQEIESLNETSKILETSFTSTQMLQVAILYQNLAVATMNQQMTANGAVSLHLLRRQCY